MKHDIGPRFPTCCAGEFHAFSCVGEMEEWDEVKKVKEGEEMRWLVWGRWTSPCFRGSNVKDVVHFSETVRLVKSTRGLRDVPTQEVLLFLTSFAAQLCMKHDI